jgi:hypothetical protein
VILATTPETGTTFESLVWSGRFHFLVNRDCNLEYLRGRMGGYVSAISVAKTKEQFISKALDSLRDRQLTPDKEIEEVEEISAKFLEGTLSDEWMALCKLAFESGDVAFNEFDLYTSA